MQLVGIILIVIVVVVVMFSIGYLKFSSSKGTKMYEGGGHGGEKLRYWLGNSSILLGIVAVAVILMFLPM